VSALPLRRARLWTDGRGDPVRLWKTFAEATECRP
jgi:hypothetical protein